MARFSVGGGLAGEGLMVHPTATAKRPSQPLAMLGGGVYTIAIGTFEQAHRELFFLTCQQPELVGYPFPPPLIR